MTRSNLVAILFVCGLFAGAACASQPQGARCDRFNGDDDCDVGLKCVEASKLAVGEPGQTWGLCCPIDQTVQPVEACFPNTSSGGGTGGAPGSGGSDSGTAGSAGSDSGAAGSAGSDSGAATGGATGTGGATATGGATGTGGATAPDAANEGGD